jgi:hypothetical protein
LAGRTSACAVSAYYVAAVKWRQARIFGIRACENRVAPLFGVFQEGCRTQSPLTLVSYQLLSARVPVRVARSIPNCSAGGERSGKQCSSTTMFLCI